MKKRWCKWSFFVVFLQSFHVILTKVQIYKAQKVNFLLKYVRLCFSQFVDTNLNIFISWKLRWKLFQISKLYKKHNSINFISHALQKSESFDK